MNAQQLIDNRDWSALAELWDEYRPDAHGVQRPVLSNATKARAALAAREEGVQLPSIAEHTYFGNRVPSVEKQLAEAGVTRDNAQHNTFVYISTNTGLWTAMNISTPFGEPQNYYGKDGYFLRDLDRGWLQYLPE